MNNPFRRLLQMKNSFLSVVALVQLLLIGLTIVFMGLTVDILDQAQDDKIRSVVVYINNHLEQSKIKALTATLTLASNQEVVRVFAARDREKLAGEVKETWERLSPLGFSQLEFHVPNKENSDYLYFYRAHNPTHFNDSAALRPTVIKANATRQVVNGLEQGRSGYGFRAVAPLFLDGQQLGSVSFGFDMGEAFLNMLNEDFKGNWGVYNLARGVKSIDDRFLIDSVGADKTKYFHNSLPEDRILQKIRDGNYYYEKEEATQTVSLYLPVRNFQGDVVVLVRYVYPTRYFGKIAYIKKSSGLICLFGLFASGIILYFLYSMITGPIHKLVIETEKIKAMDLDGDTVIDSPLIEMRELVEAMQGMKVGLQSFRKYIPDDIVRELIRTKQEAVISGKRKKMTVFFSDVVDFTRISERLTPNELSSQLSEYFSAMTEVISKHGGTVDKFIGDAIMAFWGAPGDMADHGKNACLAALGCQKALKELAVKWEREGKMVFRTRIGINTGEMVVGNIGSDQRLSYTVIGDAVNLASRLEGLNKAYGTHVIISQATLDELPDDFAYRLLDVVLVQGKTEPVPIYELVADKGDITSLDAEFLHLFSRGVAAYQSRQWDVAKNKFSKLLEGKPGDRACQIFIERCEEYKIKPPPEEWAGEYAHAKK
ncbi:MAG TPA: adenylate/guanylate cyclase domain-containing protein [Pseudomonadota bacterium]|nr:adenylate/guanylate cyclase domain-containing protein [Pseudomonadota bacterium]